MVIVLLAKKGGVGKSMVALLLHESFRQAGKSVAIHDWDVQGTSNKALALIGGQKADLKTTYDVLIYDTPPNLEHLATSYALQNADIVLVVTSPSPVDIWEANEAAQFARAKKKDATVRLLFNKVQKGTILGRLMHESAKQVGVPALAATLSARECYKHAVGQGWKALDYVARAEVLELTVALLSLGK